MDRKLKISKRFTPCPVDDGDEMYPNGIFVFNITKLTDYIKTNDFSCEEILLKDYRSHSKFNEEHLPTVDLTKPVIIAEISPGRFSVIDGNHRLEKARRLGLDKLPAYRITPERHTKFLTTAHGYRAYIEYWNGKLKDIALRSHKMMREKQ